jgi:hypothetical protein
MEREVMKKYQDFFRMWAWAALGLLVLLLIGREEQVLVVAYKGSLVCIAAFVGYWVDRNLFGRFYYEGPTFNFRVAARAAVVSAVILAFALGL